MVRTFSENKDKSSSGVLKNKVYDFQEHHVSIVFQSPKIPMISLHIYYTTDTRVIAIHERQSVICQCDALSAFMMVWVGIV